MIGLDPWSPQTPDDPGLTALLDDARAAAGDPVAALALADRAASLLPLPGTGRTAELWRGLAELAGFPKAARAAGTACSTNPLAMFIPCHRVVPASGGIGKYGGGESMKRALLELEGVVEPRR